MIGGSSQVRSGNHKHTQCFPHYNGITLCNQHLHKNIFQFVFNFQPLKNKGKTVYRLTKPFFQKEPKTQLNCFLFLIKGIISKFAIQLSSNIVFHIWLLSIRRRFRDSHRQIRQNCYSLKPKCYLKYSWPGFQLIFLLHFSSLRLFYNVTFILIEINSEFDSLKTTKVG